jgi:hypothetical protein
MIIVKVNMNAILFRIIKLIILGMLYKWWLGSSPKHLMLFYRLNVHKIELYCVSRVSLGARRNMLTLVTIYIPSLPFYVNILILYIDCSIILLSYVK